MRGGGVFKAAVAFAVGIVVGCLGLAPSLAGSADSRVAGLSTAVAQARGELEAARAPLRAGGVGGFCGGRRRGRSCGRRIRWFWMWVGRLWLGR